MTCALKLVLVTSCALLIFFGSAGIVFADEDRYVVIVDENGNAQFSYQYVVTIDWDHIVKAHEIEFIVPNDAPGLEFMTNSGKVNPELISSADGYSNYVVSVQRSTYNEPAFAMFTYDLPKFTVVRHKQNYHLRFWQDIADEETAVVYVCAPNGSREGAAPYDSRTADEKNGDTAIQESNRNLNSIQIESFPIRYYPYGGNDYDEAGQNLLVPTCPIGYERFSANFQRGKYQEILFDFRNSKHTTDTFSYSTSIVSVVGDMPYRESIIENVKLLVPVIESLPLRTQLASPARYNLTFTSPTDKIFAGNRSTASVSRDDGTILLSVELLGLGNDQFMQVNLLRAVINSASIKTYGEKSRENWWTDGASTNMAIRMMSQMNLPTEELSSVLSAFRTSLENMSAQERSSHFADLISEDMDTGALINAVIVDEIDSLCPEHVLKINNAVSGLSDKVFYDDTQFANFLLYNIQQLCGVDASILLDQYGLEHDDVQAASNEYRLLLSKYYLIKSLHADLNQFPAFESSLGEAERALASGNVDAAFASMASAESVYEAHLEPYIDILKLLNEFQEQLIGDSIGIQPSQWVVSSRLNSARKSVEQEDIQSARYAIESAERLAANSALINTVFIILVIIGLLALAKVTAKKVRKR